ncbi:MAG TPA: hypothetical protein VMT58_03780 [Candidatus Binataceae bacterium]|nr:hypothetical protein [Candidatus Binataceae bacterium]
MAISSAAVNRMLIRIRTFNPYEEIFPNRRVISRRALLIAKRLRALGHTVVIVPDDGRKLEYVTEKDLFSFLDDPIFLTVGSVALTLILNVIGNVISEPFLRRFNSSADHGSMVIEVDEKGGKLKYNEHGRVVSEERFQELIRLMKSRQASYAASRRTAAPTLDRPFPIFLEHTSRIVGWAQPQLTDEGILIENCEVTDPDTLERIKKGELKGFSIAGIVKEARCNICKGDLVECVHCPGELCGGVECIATILKMDLGEISIVREPANPGCTLKLKK